MTHPTAASAVSSTPLRPEDLGRQLLPPGSAELQRVIERQPWRVWADLAGCYAGFLLGFGLLALFPTWWSAILAFLIIGHCQYALSILTHDGDHRTLFRRRATNDLVCEILMCAPVGVDFPGEMANHGSHHRNFATEADPDRYLYALDDKSTRLDFVLYLTGLTMFPRALRKAMRGSKAEKKQLSSGGFLVRRRYLLLMQAAIFGTICLFFPWWYYLVFWLGPVYPLVFVPHKIRMFCEHAQPILPDSAADEQRMISYRPSRLEQFLFTPFNLNFHAEHHAWPFVPYYHLPELHHLMAQQPNIEVRGSYLGFLVRYFRQLPLRAPTAEASALRRSPAAP